METRVEQDFFNLIKEDKYQVFVLACRAHVPLGFFYHSWFVTNKKGLASRWEVRHFKNKEKKDWGYLYLNSQSPFQGVGVFRYSKKHFRVVNLLGFIEGGEGSTAQQAIEYIEKSKETYAYLSKYSLIGPNSNTFVEWVLDRFPEFNIKLPWRFLGKEYEERKT